jgi:hypothetical protein
MEFTFTESFNSFVLDVVLSLWLKKIKVAVSTCMHASFKQTDPNPCETKSPGQMDQHVCVDQQKLEVGRYHSH